MPGSSRFARFFSDDGPGLGGPGLLGGSHHGSGGHLSNAGSDHSALASLGGIPLDQPIDSKAGGAGAAGGGAAGGGPGDDWQARARI